MDKDKILQKTKMKIAISNEYEENIVMKNSKWNLWRNISMAVCTLFVATGVVFAGNMVVEKVFKEPKKYESYNEMIADIQADNQTTEITDEERNSLIDEEQAIIVANEVLNKFGYENQNFEKIELLKEPGIYEKYIVYSLKTNKKSYSGICVFVDAKNGKVLGFSDGSILYNDIIPEQISEEQAIIKANEMLKIFGLELEKEEYRLKEAKVDSLETNGMEKPMCQISYCKTYDGIINPYERISIEFGYKDGKVYVYYIGIANSSVKFKNNPTRITKKEAKKIALKEDKKITNNEIDFVVTNLEIRQMNSWIYLLEENGGKYPEHKREIQEDGSVQEYPQYKIAEDIARKVWVVNIHYKNNEPYPSSNIYYNAKSIYVDATTGEIVGGVNESIWEENN